MGHQKLSTRLNVGLLENAQAVNEKTSDAPHTRRKLVCHKDDTSCVSHRRSQLLSPSRHASVGYGETLETMLGVVL